MKKILPLLVILLFLSACSMSDETGTVSLNLTDAPVDMDGVVGVYITFTEIAANIPGNGEGSWETMAVFDEGKKVNLLDLTEGKTDVLAEGVELPAGRVNQIRFMLDVPEEGETPSEPGCYLLYDDDSKEALYVPSGENTGFKAVNSFTVPVNGDITVTADFDARKSLVYSAGVYKLRPTIRLIVDNEAGRITGTVSHDSSYGEYIVYAYENGSYNASEVNPNAEGIQFAGAVTSTLVKDDGSYVLAFLAAGTYDLVVAGRTGEAALEVVDTEEDISVESAKVTQQDIDTTD